MADAALVTAERARRLWAGRIAAVALLLIGEYLLISVLFDARRLTEQPGGLRVIGYVGDAALMLMVGAFAALAFRGPLLREDIAALGPAPGVRASIGGGLAHVLSFAAFLWLTKVSFSGHTPATVGSLAAWGVAGLAVGATLVGITLPGAALRVLLPRVAPALWVGLAAGVVAWAFGRGSEELWTPLGHTTLLAVIWLLERIVPTVLSDTTLHAVGLPGFVVEVSNVCSGFEGIGLISAFLGGYILLYRRELRFPHVLCVLPLGIVAVWIANVARIVALILIGGWVSPAIALGGFHSKAGWLFFCVTALCFIVLVRSSRALWARPGVFEVAEVPAGNPTVPFLLPVLCLIAVALLTGLMTPGFDRLYGVRIVATVLVLWLFRRAYRDLGWGLRWDSIAIGVGVFLMWIALVPAQTEPPSVIPDELRAMGSSAAALWVGMRLLGSVCVVPLVEELAFRGYLLRRLQSTDFSSVPPQQFGPLSLLGSSLAFGFLHGHWVAGALAGAAYAFAQRRRGHIADAVVAHAVTNGLIAIDVLAFGAWGLW